jgi:hypothetical protein
MDVKLSFLGTLLKIHFLSKRSYLSVCVLMFPMALPAQVRSKKPDRGVYQSPTIEPAQSVTSKESPGTGFGLREFSRVKTLPLNSTTAVGQKELIEVNLDDQARPGGIPPLSELRPLPIRDLSEEDAFESPRQYQSDIQLVGNSEITLVAPESGQVETRDSPTTENTLQTPILMEQLSPLHDATCDGCDSCGDSNFLSCDSMCCDRFDCDCEKRWLQHFSDHWRSDQWFGNVELMLMWRKGDRLPPLVTTGPASNLATAGQLGEPGTEVLVGNERTLGDLRAGGRLTLGKWLDDRECQGLVGRFWFAGQETMSYQTDQNETPVISRPFKNVSTTSSFQDIFHIAFPGEFDGTISVNGSSNIMGADLSVHQFLYRKYGGTIDLVYGYQYMRMDQDLMISSSSTALTSGTVPLGTTADLNDTFEAVNNFNGAQIGFASRYRERCWSFNSLLKFGFGSLNRTAKRRGSTTTTLGPSTSTINEGLLVRNSNSGKYSDHTFGWVPELDVSIGYRFFSHLDTTFGYHLIAMTDALQVSGTIDPDLAVNTTDPLTGPQRPSPSMRYHTFYLQGIHFGLQYNY